RTEDCPGHPASARAPPHPSPPPRGGRGPESPFRRVPRVPSSEPVAPHTRRLPPRPPTPFCLLLPPFRLCPEPRRGRRRCAGRHADGRGVLGRPRGVP